MTKPVLEDFANGDGTYNYEEYEEILGMYEDIVYDESIDFEEEEDEDE